MNNRMNIFAAIAVVAAGLIVVFGLASPAEAAMGLGCMGMAYIPLVDGSLALQAAVTKIASFDGAALDMGEGYAPGGLGQAVGAVVDVTAIDLANLDETYSFKLQESADALTWTDAGPAKAAGAVGTVVVRGLITARYVRLSVTIAGTTPSITYSAGLGF